MLEKIKEQILKIATGDFFQEHIQESISSIQELTPILVKNGYELEALNLELGFPTGITIELKRNAEQLGDLEALEKESEGQKIKSLIIKSIRKINSGKEKFKKSGLEISEIHIGIKVPPVLNVKLRPIKP